jgi:hypothetical protein
MSVNNIDEKSHSTGRKSASAGFLLFKDILVRRMYGCCTSICKLDRLYVKCYLFRRGVTLKNLLIAFAVLALIGLTMGLSKNGMSGIGYVMLGGAAGVCLWFALQPSAQPEFTMGSILGLIVVSACLLSRDNDCSTLGYPGIVIMTIASFAAGAASSFLFVSVHERQEQATTSRSDRPNQPEEN